MADSIKLILVLLITSSLSAQKPKIYWLEPKPAVEIQKDAQNYLNQIADSLSHKLWGNKLQTHLQNKGYWFSKVALDKKDSLLVSVQAGTFLELGQMEIQIKDSLQTPKPLVNYNHPALSRKNLNDQINYYLNFYEENGYPFAEARLEEYFWKQNTLTGRVQIEPGPRITWDSVAIKGFDNFTEATLRYELGFYQGRPYQESYLKKLKEYAQQIEYLSFTRPPAVAFFENKTTLFLYTQEQKGNQIDGVVGLNTQENGETTFNGDFQLRLLNIFKKGEDLQLRWRRPDASIQELQLGLIWPFLFKSPLWLNTNFELFRQDSSFVNTNFNGLLKYRVARQSFISGGVNYRSSNALQNTDGPTTNTGNFTNLNSFSTITYLLGTEINRLNRALVPYSGYRIEAFAKSGQRSTDQNEQNQLGWLFNTEWLWPFYGNMVAKVGFNSQGLIGENLFENELFRLGGLRSLRGFNEQSIFSSGFAIGTLEYRYRIGEYDYLTLFTDLAYTTKNVGESSETNWLNGVGTGINFRTKGGIFSLFLAVGHDQNSNFDFRTTKVHFGYVNQF